MFCTLFILIYLSKISNSNIQNCSSVNFNDYQSKPELYSNSHFDTLKRINENKKILGLNIHETNSFIDFVCNNFDCNFCNNLRYQQAKESARQTRHGYNDIEYKAVGTESQNTEQEELREINNSINENISEKKLKIQQKI